MDVKVKYSVKSSVREVRFSHRHEAPKRNSSLLKIKKTNQLKENNWMVDDARNFA